MAENRDRRVELLMTPSDYEKVKRLAYANTTSVNDLINQVMGWVIEEPKKEEVETKEVQVEEPQQSELEVAPKERKKRMPNLSQEKEDAIYNLYMCRCRNKDICTLTGYTSATISLAFKRARKRKFSK